jgi:hypothetical protein
LQQVVSYLGYTGRDANVVAEAAFDPKRPFARAQSCKGTKPHLETLRRTGGIKSRAMLSHAPDDKASAFDLLGFPEIDRAHSLPKSHFFYFGHVTFSFLGGCKYLNVAIRRHSSAPLAGLVTKCWARGGRYMLRGIHANYRSRRR